MPYQIMQKAEANDFIRKSPPLSGSVGSGASAYRAGRFPHSYPASGQHSKESSLHWAAQVRCQHPGCACAAQYPPLGHNWQVKQTVTTQYDDTGQLTQQGYTIFECSRCHEQYKSQDGTLLPGGDSGTDPGGGEGETIWDKLANLIGAVGSGILSVIEGVLGKLLDALLSWTLRFFEYPVTLYGFNFSLWQVFVFSAVA